MKIPDNLIVTLGLIIYMLSLLIKDFQTANKYYIVLYRKKEFLSENKQDLI